MVPEYIRYFVSKTACKTEKNLNEKETWIFCTTMYYANTQTEIIGVYVLKVMVFNNLQMPQWLSQDRARSKSRWRRFNLRKTISYFVKISICRNNHAWLFVLLWCLANSSHSGRLNNLRKISNQNSSSYNAF